MTTIVAFTGKRGSGKDTAAKALVAEGYTLMSFADPLREILMIVYGLTMEELTDPVIKEQPLNRFPWKSPRELMTTIGTQGFRDLIHQETWVKALERRALQHDKVVVADLRFLTEEAMLKEHGATIIRVVSPEREKNDAHAQHRSETEMDQIVPTHTVINNGTIEDLHRHVRGLVLPPLGTYRKTALIDAVQLNWKNWSDVCDHMGGIISMANPARSVATYSDTCGEDGPYIEITIPTKEGDMIAQHGDFIAKGVEGEFWAIKPSIFRKSYERVPA